MWRGHWLVGARPWHCSEAAWPCGWADGAGSRALSYLFPAGKAAGRGSGGGSEAHRQPPRPGPARLWFQPRSYLVNDLNPVVSARLLLDGWGWGTTPLPGGHAGPGAPALAPSPRDRERQRAEGLLCARGPRV